MATMKRIIEEFRKDRERVLDQLVDGALTEEDQKQVLKALEEEPGGWRRCALAFLEAQTWRSDMLSFRAEAPPKPTIAEPPVEAPQRALPLAPPRPSRFFEVGLALAACVVLAFGVSVWMRSDNTTGSPNRLVGNGSAANANVVSSYSPWHAKLKYDDPATAGSESLDVPLVEPHAINKDWVQGQRSALPDEVRRDLEQSGHRVIQRHYLHSTPLKDGRRVLVPIEQIDVEPSPRPAY